MVTHDYARDAHNTALNGTTGIDALAAVLVSAAMSSAVGAVAAAGDVPAFPAPLPSMA